MTTTITYLAYTETIESVREAGKKAPDDGIYIQTRTITEVEWGAPGETTEDVDTDAIVVEQLADDDAFRAALDAAGWLIVGDVDHSNSSVSAIVEPKS